MSARQREPQESRAGTLLFFESEKLRRSVACESLQELSVARWLNRSPDIVWFQEQPVKVPYGFKGKPRSYYPDFAVVDASGKAVLFEVKSPFDMFRELTLAKSLACIQYASERGMGYLIADNRGRTLKDYSHIPYDLELASRIERLMDEQATLSFQVVREFFVASYGRFELPQFVSTVINRDWAVTSELVTVDRLAPEMSFRSLLERHP